MTNAPKDGQEIGQVNMCHNHLGNLIGDPFNVSQLNPEIDLGGRINGQPEQNRHYLGSDYGTDTMTEQPIVVVTMRLDPHDSLCPSNLVLSTSQTERLRDDLFRILGSI